MKKISAGIFKWCVFALAGLFLTASVLFLVLQTSFASNILINTLNRSLSEKNNMKVEVKALKGIIPFHFEIGGLVINDRDGKWMEIHNCSVKVDPFDLLKGRLFIEKLHLTGVKVSRLPHKNVKTDKKLPEDFRLPTSLSRITIGDIQAPDIDLDSSILGTPAQFRLSGGVTDSGSEEIRDYNLELARVDHITESLRASAHIGIDPQHMDVKITIHEPGKGIIYQLTGMGEDIKCSVEGNGDLSHWQGKLHSYSRDLGEITSDIIIRAVKDFNVNISGNFLFADSFIGEKYRAITGKGADFKIDADFVDGDVRLNDFEIKTGKLETDYKGRIRLAGLDSEGTFTLNMEDGASIDKIVKGYSIGGLSSKGSLNGKLFSPYIDLSYSIAGLENDQIAASELNGAVKINFKNRNDSEEIMSLSSDGDLKGFIFRSENKEYEEEKITYRFELARNNNRQLNIKLFEADSGSFNLHAWGILDTSDKQADLEGVLKASNMGRYYPEASDLLNGKGSINFRLDADFTSNSFNGFMKGSYSLLLNKQDLKIPVSDDITFEGRVHLADEVIECSGIKIDTGSATLEGSGTYGLKGKIDSRVTLSVPDLSVASAYINNSVGGSATVNCFLKGEVNRFEITSDAEIKDFSWNEFNAGNVSGKYYATQRAKRYKGNISLEFSPGDQKLKTGSDFYLSGKEVSLKNIYLSGMQTEMGGAIAYDRNNRLLNGKMDFSVADISKVLSLYGKSMDGSVSGEVVFNPEKKKQNLEISASGKKIIYNGNMVEDITVKGSLADIFGRVFFTASGAAKGFVHKGVVLNTVEIAGQGERDNSEFYLKGSGRAGEGLDFESSIDLVNQNEKRMVTIKSMNGTFGSSQVKMMQPLTISYSADTLLVGDIDINIDSGNISGLLKYTPENVNGNLMVNDMPLSLLALAGSPVLDGKLEGSVNLGGGPSAPDVSGSISINGIKRRTLKKSRVPSFSIQAEYNLNKDNVSGRFTMEELSGAALGGNITVPCSFSIYPFMLVLKNNEPMNGGIKGEFDLSVIPTVFEIHDQIITGRLDSGFDIGGYYRSPSITGTAALSNGSYENPGMGILLKDIEAEISADNSGLRLHDFKADDGLSGKITGSGHMDFVARNDFTYEINMALRNMQLTRNDSLTVVLGGNTVISGSMKQNKISGSLIVEKADFEITEKKTVEITELEINEIYREVDTIQEETGEQPSANKIKFDLTVSSPGRMYIKGRGLDSEWKGDVKLEGTSDSPVITGKLSLVRGRYDFLSKPFTLTEGQVTFFGKTPPDPYFDVTGKSENSDITAYINLKGNIRNPVLDLYSEPALPQDEVLARVLFGREISQITPLQAVQLAAALNEMLGQKKSFDPLNYTKNLIGVDRLEIKQSQANPDESALSAGKYLNEDVYIEVEKGTSAESGKASVTWELTPHITVETEVGENAETEVGINWKHDY